MSKYYRIDYRLITTRKMIVEADSFDEAEAKYEEEDYIEDTEESVENEDIICIEIMS